MPTDDAPDSQQSATAPSPLAPAGFWLRAAATLVDGGLMVLPAEILAQCGWRGGDSLLGAILLYLAVPACWACACLARWSATPGKRLLGLVVVDIEDQSRPPLIRHIKRSVVGNFSWLPLGLGCLWVAIDPRKQAWHDKLTRTQVVRRSEVDLRRRLLPLLLVGLGTVAAIGIWGWTWLRANRAALLAQGKRIQAEAEEYGRTHDGRGCTDEAFSRLDACDGLMCKVGTGVFLRHCLLSAPLQSLDCADVPAKGEILQSVAWQLQRCEARQRSDDACGQLMRTYGEVCRERYGTDPSD